MRFGIGMNTDHALEEVGQQFSVTRKRSWQRDFSKNCFWPVRNPIRPPSFSSKHSLKTENQQCQDNWTESAFSSSPPMASSRRNL